MDANLTKSLNDLIDETLQELDELRKSRFSASEIKVEGPGDGIAGKPSDGDLHAKKAEDKDEEEDEKEEASEDKDCAKGEDDPADSEETKRKLKDLMNKKEEDKDKDEDEDDKEPHKDDAKHEEKEKKVAKELLDMHKAELKKSSEQHESLMKSYVEERVKPLEEKLSTILDLVNKIADQPVAPKGSTARTTPLFKSTEEGTGETLTKAQVANKLFELKKSGTKVDSNDIVKAEMGQDLNSIIKKYEIS
jgi:hypothetical protein